MRGGRNDSIELSFFVDTCDLMIPASKNRSAACRASQIQHNVHTVRSDMPNYSIEMGERRLGQQKIDKNITNSCAVCYPNSCQPPFL